jgi:TrmH family RNA methyltransferase
MHSSLVVKDAKSAHCKRRRRELKAVTINAPTGPGFILAKNTFMYSTNIRIVLVHPTHPGNIGGAARAMKNMGLTNLHLVAPIRFPDTEASARAAGAEDVLVAAHVHPDLDHALEGCSLVIGTSARKRSIPWPSLDPKAGAEKLVKHAAPAALLFGRERMGLTNAELDRCHYVMSIPTNPVFPSLNLAGAVQIMAYEIFLAAQSAQGQAVSLEREPLASHEDLQRLYHHLEEVLVQIAFLDPANPRKLMRRLMRLINRAELDQNELNILRGILTAMQQRLSNNT